MSMQHDHQHAERPATHGMLMVGETRVLLSHLPMFHAPHDFQVLLQVNLSAAGADPLSIYRDDRKVTGNKLYTWVPKPFVLSELIVAPENAFVMVGTIFRGHFERGGVAITSDKVEARVERVLFSRRLNASDPPLVESRYLMFGSPAEPFLAHVITRPPDFDQIVSVETAAALPADWDGAGIALKIEKPGAPPNTPLKEGDLINATRLDGPAAGAASMTVRTEFYFETGELEA